MKASFLGLLVVLGWVLAAGATTLAPFTFDDQVRDSDVILRGRVQAIQAERRTTENGEAIFSKVTFEPIEVYKGKVAGVLTLDFLGGQIGEESMVVEGMPKFAPGQEVILFVSGERNRVCPVVGWSEGSLRVERDGAGEGEVRLTPRAQAVASVERTRRALRSDDRMALGEFETMLKTRMTRLGSK